MTNWKTMKIWTNNKFKGFNPVGSAAVVVAPTAQQAADYLSMFLREIGLDDAKIEDMKEMSFIDGQVSILCDGDY